MPSGVNITTFFFLPSMDTNIPARGKIKNASEHNEHAKIIGKLNTDCMILFAFTTYNVTSAQSVPSHSISNLYVPSLSCQLSITTYPFTLSCGSKSGRQLSGWIVPSSVNGLFKVAVISGSSNTVTSL